MDTGIKYPWQQTVLDAVLASHETLPAKINIAEKAVAARLEDAREIDLDERLSIKEALNLLNKLIAEAKTRPPRREERKGIA